jgi:maltose alpha-D-glucosyltransferase/alpha-amylase
LPSQLALARVRRGSRVGLLTDAFSIADFPRAIINGFARASVLETDQGEIRFEPTSRMQDVSVPPDAEMNWLSAEQSNSSVIVGDVAIVKLFRRVTDGPHPEAEMGRYLTENGFEHTPALLGEVVRVGQDGVRHALAIAQAFVRNQGDAWTWTLDLLQRGLSDITSGDEAVAADAARHTDYDQFASLVGRRLGCMHLILARSTDNPDFAPEHADAAMTASWADHVEAQLDAALAALANRSDLAAEVAAQAQAIRDARDALGRRARELAEQAAGAAITRTHGDLHLGQVLVVNGDVNIIDFEGEPAKPIAFRRGKSSRMRDVAGMIRSFDYAAAVVRRTSPVSHAHLDEPRVAAFLDSFGDQATRCFLAGYRQEMEVSPAEEGLLELFLTEKAAYEICYESANRPTWIDVPLSGLARLADTLLARPEHA